MPGAVPRAVDVWVNRCRMTGLPHKAVILPDGDGPLIHPEGVQLDLMRAKFPDPIVAADLTEKPTRVPCATTPEAEDRFAVRAHYEAACRDEDERGGVHHIYGVQALRLPDLPRCAKRAPTGLGGCRTGGGPPTGVPARPPGRGRRPRLGSV